MPTGLQIGMLVSPEDADLLDLNWSVDRYGYARRTAAPEKGMRRKTMISHRLIAGRAAGRQLTTQDIVDHINRNKLDNRRENLRLVGKSENAMNRDRRSDNTSGAKGVSWCKAAGKWQWECLAFGVRYTGRESTVDAAKARLLEKRREVGYDAVAVGVF